MTQLKHIKNLGISLVFAAILIYVLILNPSTVGLVSAVVAIGLLLLIAFAFNKNQMVVQKFDMYILVTFFGYYAINYLNMIETFSANVFVGSMENYEAFQIILLIVSIILGLVFNAIGENRVTTIAKVIFKTIGVLLPPMGLSVFCWGGFSASNLEALLFIGVVCALIAFARGVRTGDATEIRRPMRIALWLGIFTVLISVFFPYYEIDSRYFISYFSSILLRWYIVLILSLILLSTIVIGIRQSNNKVDTDGLFLIGLLGLLWVAKAAVYFYFIFSWIAICVYLVLMIGFFNRFAKRKNNNSAEVSLYSSIGKNEFWWIIIAAVSIVAAVFFINKGYIFLALSLGIGAFVVSHIHKLVTGWVSEAVYWVSLLFAVAFSACMLAVQNGYSPVKIGIIAALFIFSAIVMVLLCHNNSIGKNKFKAGKIAMVLVFALLVVIPAYKGGSHIEMEIYDGDGSYDPAISFEAVADGKNNEIVGMRYVWSDSFMYDQGAMTVSSSNDEYMIIENRHLIVWTMDSNGIETRSDYWFAPDHLPHR